MLEPGFRKELWSMLMDIENSLKAYEGCAHPTDLDALTVIRNIYKLGEWVGLYPPN